MNTKNTLKKLILLSMIALCFTSLKAQFSGTYSIGTTGDIDSIQSAIDSLVQVGVSGPTTFEIDSGIYYEYIYFQPIPGASEANRVTFKAKNDSVNDVFIYNTVYFLGGDYITLKSLTIESNTNCIKLQGGSDHITIDGCVIKGLKINLSNRFYDAISGYDYSNDSYTTIKNCKIMDGSCAIYLQGNRNSPNEVGHIIENNEIIGSFVHNVGTYLVDSVIVRNNVITNNTNNTSGAACGIILNNSSNAVIEGNKVSVYKHGIRIHNNIDANDSILVLNNMITTNRNNNNYFYALYLSNGNKNLKIYNNNFYNSFISTYGVIYSQANNNDANIALVNNNVISASSKIAMFNSNPDSYTMDYNNFYSTSNNFNFSINGEWHTDLEAISEFVGSNNISINPMYVNSNDLHVSNSLIGNTGTPLSEVTHDFDNEPRNANNPDIGADEFDPFDNYDLAITDIDFIEAPICTAPTEISLAFKNIGSETITEYKVERSKNNVVTDTMTFTTTLNSYQEETTTFAYGEFTDGDSIKYKVVEINGLTDPTAENSTYENNGIWLSLKENIEISNTAEFDSTFDAIRTRGICNSIEVSILPGIYESRLRLFEIPGSGPDAIITIKSSTAKREDVIIAPDNASNFVIDLKGTDYITLKDLTLKADSINSYGIYFNGEANHLTFDNLHIKADVNGSYEGIYSGSGDDHNLTISNCLIENGDYAIYLEGDSQEDSVKITNNTILNSEYGIYLQNMKNVAINNNYIKIDSSYSAYGFEIYNIYGCFEMLNNQVLIDSTSGAGADIENLYGIGAKPSVIANNVFHIGGQPWAGVYTYEIVNTKFFNNTIVVSSNNNNDYALYFDYFSVLDVRNNQIIAQGNATPLRLGSEPVGLTYMDYNNIYTSGDRLVNFFGSNITTLSDWQEIGWDAHSLSVNPEFNDSYKSCKQELNNKGIYVDGVPELDLNGVKRNKNTPDMGAIEFGMPGDRFLGDDFLMCDESYQLDAGSAESYNWSNGESTQKIQITAPGEYRVQVSACEVSYSDTIVVLSPEISADFNVVVNEYTAALINTSQGEIDNYLWNIDGYESTSMNEAINFNGNGTYIISLEVSNECRSDMADTTLVFTYTGIEDVSISKLSVFPNPVSESLNLTIDSEVTESVVISIFNAMGQMEMNLQDFLHAGTNTLSFDVSQLNQGVYYLKINNLEAIKILKQ